MASETPQAISSISPPSTPPPPISKSRKRRSVSGAVPKCVSDQPEVAAATSTIATTAATTTAATTTATATATITTTTTTATATAPNECLEISISEDHEPGSGSGSGSGSSVVDKAAADDELLEQDQDEGQETTPTTTPRKTSTRSSRARVKDLESAILTLQKQRREMIEDIELYKLDIIGFKKDLARRDAHLHELQFTPEVDALRSAHARAVEELRTHRAAANAVVAKREAEIAGLEGVVAGLKMSIAANTRVEEAVGDEVFREVWGRIGYDVMNWCLANGAVKGGVLDVAGMEQGLAEEVRWAVPGFERLVRGGMRVHVVQAIVARRLVGGVFGGWFLGVEREWEEVLAGMERGFGETCTPSSLTHWRTTTRLLLRTHLLSTPHLLGTLTTTLTAQLLHLSSQLLPTPPTPAREKSLTAIVDQTIRIATLMRCQRAEFRVAAVKVGDGWDPEWMDDLTGEEEEGAGVCCVAWPGVEKWGDEMGEGGGRRCVVRARVVCEVGE